MEGRGEEDDGIREKRRKGKGSWPGLSASDGAYAHMHE